MGYTKTAGSQPNATIISSMNPNAARSIQMEATPIQAIDQRIDDLTQQRATLLAELDALKQARRLIQQAANGNVQVLEGTGYSITVGSHAKPKAKRQTRKPKTNYNGNKTRQGQRAQAILALLKSTTDPLEIPSIARSLGMKEPNYLYRALPRLAGQGLVKSTDDKPPRWTLATR